MRPLIPHFLFAIGDLIPQHVCWGCHVIGIMYNMTVFLRAGVTEKREKFSVIKIHVIFCAWLSRLMYTFQSFGRQSKDTISQSSRFNFVMQGHHLLSCGS